MNALAYQIKLDITTGIRTNIPVRAGISIVSYFRSLNILNVGGPLYGVVYLATEDAIAELDRLVAEGETK